MNAAEDSTASQHPETPQSTRGVIHVIVMGVSGSGKTTLARKLGERTGRPILEADDLHPAENLARLRGGDIPEEAGYASWLGQVRDWMSEHGQQGQSTIVACPVLTRAHRDLLSQATGITFFVHLYGTRDVLARRMAHRIGVDMPAELLDKQLNQLQKLYSDELGVQLDVSRTPDQLVEDALAAAKFAEKAYGEH